MRGYFGIGIYNGKFHHNVGTLWRSAYQMGAAFIFIIGKRIRKQASDTTKSWRHIPLFEYENFEQFFLNRPYDCPLVGVEFPGKTIQAYQHPQRAIYLLGAEDGGLPVEIRRRCQDVIQLPAVNIESYNVAVAGSIVMYDRFCKQEVKQ